jgi:flagellar FliL protein
MALAYVPIRQNAVDQGAPMAVQNLDKEGDENEPVVPEAPKKKLSMGKIIIILVSVLVLAGGGAGAYFYFNQPHQASAGAEAEGKDGGQVKAAPVYYAFDPAFVVNFQDSSAIRFLQVTIEVMSRDPVAIEAVKTHMPVIRNSLVLLFSSQTPENIMTREGKEKIRTDALKEIQKVMKEQTGSPSIEAVYFTGFVMQ